MAKKTDSTSKPAAPMKRVAKTTPTKIPAPKAAKAPATKALAVPAPIVAAPPIKAPAASAPVAKKPAAKKPKAKAKRAAKPAASAYTHEDVSLRAYFIAEKRRNEGLPGDEHQDWIEAERQLAAETSKGKRAKKNS